LSEDQQVAAIALFEAGWGKRSVARRLGVGVPAIHRLYDRWRVRGGGALVTKPTKRSFAFAFKMEVVRRFLDGESKLSLAKEFDLSSPKLIESWARGFRNEGEDALRPKRKGRPPADTDASSAEESELQQLRRENERLKAEVAYLGKLRALRAHERR
jgi:transposase-like protein